MTFPRSSYSYGIALNGHYMEIVACDQNGFIRYRHRSRMPDDNAASWAQHLVTLVKNVDADFAVNTAVGIALPRTLHRHVRRASDADVGLAPAIIANLQAALTRRVVVASEAQCFAVSEANGGAAHAFPTTLGLLVAEDLMSAHVVNGRLWRGRMGRAGELGHWPVMPQLLKKYGLPLLPCCCGKTACIACYVSLSGLQNLKIYARAALAASSRGVAQHNGDAGAIPDAVLSMHLDLLGAAIALLIQAYDPHAMVLGGAVAMMPHVQENIRQAIAPHLLAGTNVPPILGAEFGELSVVRGAALLAAFPPHYL